MIRFLPWQTMGWTVLSVLIVAPLAYLVLPNLYSFEFTLAGIYTIALVVPIIRVRFDNHTVGVARIRSWLIVCIMGQLALAGMILWSVCSPFFEMVDKYAEAANPYLSTILRFPEVIALVAGVLIVLIPFVYMFYYIIKSILGEGEKLRLRHLLYYFF